MQLFIHNRVRMTYFIALPPGSAAPFPNPEIYSEEAGLWVVRGWRHGGGGGWTITSKTKANRGWQRTFLSLFLSLSLSLFANFCNNNQFDINSQTKNLSLSWHTCIRVRRDG